jgi:hypothetical protein
VNNSAVGSFFSNHLWIGYAHNTLYIMYMLNNKTEVEQPSHTHAKFAGTGIPMVHLFIPKQTEIPDLTNLYRMTHYKITTLNLQQGKE